MTDAELLARFERLELAEFRHADHVRVAWAYLQRDGERGALEALVRGLRVVAQSKGHPEKFHYTLTRAWLELMATARRRHPDVTTAAELLARVPSLADSALRAPVLQRCGARRRRRTRGMDATGPLAL